LANAGKMPALLEVGASRMPASRATIMCIRIRATPKETHPTAHGRFGGVSSLRFNVIA
jgi:hypothetical protein